ncbi:MAG: DnaD domain protein [Candidatus Izimaplasma sp.]|nr:DnaD domain protein [Candidatus Izimaplasma bacterium]
MKRYINNNTIDFTELILNNYYKIGIDETDAIIVIKLQYLLNKNITFISPSQLSKMLSISKQTTSKRLKSLIEKGFIKMEVIKNNNGKQSESFNLDYLIESILVNGINDENNEKEEFKKTIEIKIVKLFEEEFKKPLSVLDIQTITKWLNDDKYSFEKIKDALFEAVRIRKLTIKYVDGILLKSEDKIDKRKYKRTATISNLKKIWEE